jgi:hypothetical protein
LGTGAHEFKPGDILKVEAEGVGRVVLTRVDELIDRYSGCLETGGDLRGRVKGLREEWRWLPAPGQTNQNV